MSIASSTSRLTEYYRRHGFTATLSRTLLAAKRMLFAGRMVVFYCDLDVRRMSRTNISGPFRVERLRSLVELKPEQHRQMIEVWNPKLADRLLRERFEKGASLWLVQHENELAGFGWTLHGQAIATYYFPLGSDDVQLFDFYVFACFRGRALHWLLTNHILNELAVEGRTRAFADTGEWNEAQLASFTMTPFRPLGLVKTYKIFGRVLTRWAPFELAPYKRKITTGKRQPVKIVRPNE